MIRFFVSVFILSIGLLYSIDCSRKRAVVEVVSDKSVVFDMMPAIEEIAEPKSEPVPMPEPVRDPDPVYFGYDSYELTHDQYLALKSIIDYIKANDGLEYVLEGFCDNRGNDRYNNELGMKRAEAVRTNIGFNKCMIISYGKTQSNKSCKSEECYHNDRKVVLKIYP